MCYGGGIGKWQCENAGRRHLRKGTEKAIMAVFSTLVVLFSLLRRWKVCDAFMISLLEDQAPTRGLLKCK